MNPAKLTSSPVIPTINSSKFQNKNLNAPKSSVIGGNVSRSGVVTISSTKVRYGKTVGPAAAPNPLNTPSLKRENKGKDVNVSIVPAAGNSGIWGLSSSETKVEDSGQSVKNNATKPAPWASKPLSTTGDGTADAAVDTKATVAKAVTKSWAEVESDEEEPVVPNRTRAQSNSQIAANNTSNTVVNSVGDREDDNTGIVSATNRNNYDDHKLSNSSQAKVAASDGNWRSSGNRGEDNQSSYMNKGYAMHGNNNYHANQTNGDAAGNFYVGNRNTVEYNVSRPKPFNPSLNIATFGNAGTNSSFTNYSAQPVVGVPYPSPFGHRLANNQGSNGNGSNQVESHQVPDRAVIKEDSAEQQKAIETSRLEFEMLEAKKKAKLQNSASNRDAMERNTPANFQEQMNAPLTQHNQSFGMQNFAQYSPVNNSRAQQGPSQNVTVVNRSRYMEGDDSANHFNPAFKHEIQGQQYIPVPNQGQLPQYNPTLSSVNPNRMNSAPALIYNPNAVVNHNGGERFYTPFAANTFNPNAGNPNGYRFGNSNNGFPMNANLPPPQYPSMADEVTTWERMKPQTQYANDAMMNQNKSSLGTVQRPPIPIARTLTHPSIMLAHEAQLQQMQNQYGAFPNNQVAFNNQNRQTANYMTTHDAPPVLIKQAKGDQMPRRFIQTTGQSANASMNNTRSEGNSDQDNPAYPNNSTGVPPNQSKAFNVDPTKSFASLFPKPSTETSDKTSATDEPGAEVVVNDCNIQRDQSASLQEQPGQLLTHDQVHKRGMLFDPKSNSYVQSSDDFNRNASRKVNSNRIKPHEPTDEVEVEKSFMGKRRIGKPFEKDDKLWERGTALPQAINEIKPVKSVDIEAPNYEKNIVEIRRKPTTVLTRPKVELLKATVTTNTVTSTNRRAVQTNESKKETEEDEDEYEDIDDEVDEADDQGVNVKSTKQSLASNLYRKKRDEGNVGYVSQVRSEQQSEQQRQLQERKEARTREKANRPPRTKGILFRYNEDGQLEGVFRTEEERLQYEAFKESKIGKPRNATHSHNIKATASTNETIANTVDSDRTLQQHDVAHSETPLVTNTSYGNPKGRGDYKDPASQMDMKESYSTGKRGHVNKTAWGAPGHALQMINKVMQSNVNNSSPDVDSSMEEAVQISTSDIGQTSADLTDDRKKVVRSSQSRLVKTERPTRDRTGRVNIHRKSKESTADGQTAPNKDSSDALYNDSGFATNHPGDHNATALRGLNDQSYETNSNNMKNSGAAPPLIHKSVLDGSNSRPFNLGIGIGMMEPSNKSSQLVRPTSIAPTLTNSVIATVVELSTGLNPNFIPNSRQSANINPTDYRAYSNSLHDGHDSTDLDISKMAKETEANRSFQTITEFIPGLGLSELPSENKLMRSPMSKQQQQQHGYDEGNSGLDRYSWSNGQIVQPQQNPHAQLDKSLSARVDRSARHVTVGSMQNMSANNAYPTLSDMAGLGSFTHATNNTDFSSSFFSESANDVTTHWNSGHNNFYVSHNDPMNANYLDSNQRGNGSEAMVSHYTPFDGISTTISSNAVDSFQMTRSTHIASETAESVIESAAHADKNWNVHQNVTDDVEVNNHHVQDDKERSYNRTGHYRSGPNGGRGRGRDRRSVDGRGADEPYSGKVSGRSRGYASTGPPAANGGFTSTIGEKASQSFGGRGSKFTKRVVTSSKETDVVDSKQPHVSNQSPATAATATSTKVESGNHSATQEVADGTNEGVKCSQGPNFVYKSHNGGRAGRGSYGRVNASRGRGSHSFKEYVKREPEAKNVEASKQNETSFDSRAAHSESNEISQQKSSGSWSGVRRSTDPAAGRGRGRSNRNQHSMVGSRFVLKAKGTSPEEATS